MILAKRELQAKYYGSKDLFKYLDDIVIRFSDGTEIYNRIVSRNGTI